MRARRICRWVRIDVKLGVCEEVLLQLFPFRQPGTFPRTVLRLARHVAGDDLKAAGAIHFRPLRGTGELGIEVFVSALLGSNLGMSSIRCASLCSRDRHFHAAAALVECWA